MSIILNKIKILLVEDDSNWITLISKLLQKEEDLLLVKTTDDSDDAINYTKNNYVDLAILDLSLTTNNLEGLALASKLKTIKDIKIVILTSLSSQEIILDSFVTGATQFLSKENCNCLASVVRTAMHNPMPVEILTQNYCNEITLKNLSTAENEVFNLLHSGYDKNEIAKKLNKSPKTVKNQITGILKKLDVKSCKQAIRLVDSKKFSQYT